MISRACGNPDLSHFGNKYFIGGYTLTIFFVSLFTMPIVKELCAAEIHNLSCDVFPTMWHFDKYRLRQAFAATFLA